MLSIFIKLPFVIKVLVLSIFEWLFYTGFTVYHICIKALCKNAWKFSGFNRVLNFGMNLHLRPYLVCASSEGSDETVLLLRLVRDSPARISSKYQNLTN